MSNQNKDMLSFLIGRKVLIRDHMAGVFITTLADVKGKQWSGGVSRKIHYWDGAGAVEGISTTGVNLQDSRITEVTEISNGQDLVQILPLSDDVYYEIMGAKVWNPK